MGLFARDGYPRASCGSLIPTSPWRRAERAVRRVSGQAARPAIFCIYGRRPLFVSRRHRRRLHY